MNKERFNCIIGYHIAMTDNTSKYFFIQYTCRNSYLRNKHGDPSIFLARWYCSTSLVMLRSFQQNLITFVYLYPATLTCLLHTFLGKSWLLYMPEMGVNVRLLNLDITLSNTFCTYYGHYSRNGPLMMMMGTTLFLFSKAFNHVICQI